MPDHAPPPNDLSKLERLPSTYQAITDYFGKLGQANPFPLRLETFKRIEKITGRPLVCYVTKTRHLPQGVPAYIDDSDLTGIGDLIHSVGGESLTFSSPATEDRPKLANASFDCCADGSSPFGFSCPRMRIAPRR